MARPPIGDTAISNTERTRRRRQRLLDEVAEQKRIAEKYFGGRPPLTAPGYES